jgi:spectinomycin phosphotransferase
VEEEVIENPDVPDEVILQALEECYSIREARLEFVPRGLDSGAWAFRVDAGEQAYFLKVSRRTEDTIGAWMPLFLSQQAMEQVIPTLPARSGEAYAVADGLMYRLQRFVPGRSAMDAGMPAQKWEEFGAFLRRLHSLELPAEVSGQLRRERFESRRWKRVSELHGRIHPGSSTDPVAAEMLEFWQGHEPSVEAILARTAALAKRVQLAEHPMVLCHADVHTNNVLLGDDGRLYVIDWDDARLAPKERDLMFVLAEAGEAEKRSFFTGYEEATIDPLLLAFYQHEWCVEDIGAFAEEILDLDGSSAGSRVNSLSWFKSLFAPGNSVPTALGNEIGARMLQGAGAAAGGQE